MFNKDLFLKKKDLIKDSKLCLYLDENLHFKFEIKNLSRKTTYLFLYVILDELIKENIIEKEFLQFMIDKVL